MRTVGQQRTAPPWSALVFGCFPDVIAAALCMYNRYVDGMGQQLASEELPHFFAYD